MDICNHKSKFTVNRNNFNLFSFYCKIVGKVNQADLEIRL